MTDHTKAVNAAVTEKIESILSTIEEKGKGYLIVSTAPEDTMHFLSSIFITVEGDKFRLHFLEEWEGEDDHILPIKGAAEKLVWYMMWYRGGNNDEADPEATPKDYADGFEYSDKNDCEWLHGSSSW